MAENEIGPPLDPSLDVRIMLALQAAPRTEIPADFAARISAQISTQLPAPGAVTLNPGRYGRLAAAACMVVLLVLMLVFGHRTTGSSLYWFSIQSIFCAQFALLAVWLVARGYTSASST